MKIILSTLLLAVVLFAGAVFYFFKPAGLGISYTNGDLKSIQSKLKVRFESLPNDAKTDKKLIVFGAHPVETSFTSQELTAAVDNRHNQYVYFPFHNVQIRVNTDGSVEGTATVNYNDTVNYLLVLGVSYQDIIKAAAKFKVPNINIPVYLKASGSILNNLGHINIHSVKIANISIPENLVKQYGPGINDLVESVIRERQPSYNIEKLEVKDSKVYFKGTSPDVEMAARKL